MHWLIPGSVGAFLVGWGSSLRDSHIVHLNTVPCHCHPGQLKDKDKDSLMYFSSHANSVNQLGGYSPCCCFWRFPDALLWLLNTLQPPLPPSRCLIPFSSNRRILSIRVLLSCAFVHWFFKLCFKWTALPQCIVMIIRLCWCQLCPSQLFTFTFTFTFRLCWCQLGFPPLHFHIHFQALLVLAMAFSSSSLSVAHSLSLSIFFWCLMWLS